MSHLNKIRFTPFFGPLAGLCMIALMYGTYLGGIRAFMSPVSYLGYLVLIGWGVAAVLIRKKNNGGYLGFQDAVKTCFKVFVIGLALQTLFYWLLLNVLDPHFKQVFEQASSLRAKEVYQRLGGMSEEQAQRAIDNEQGQDQFSLGRMVMGLAFIYIILFIVALLIAAVVRRKTPAS
jgi:hypothetical protein